MHNRRRVAVARSFFQLPWGVCEVVASGKHSDVYFDNDEVFVDATGTRIKPVNSGDVLTPLLCFAKSDNGAILTAQGEAVVTHNKQALSPGSQVVCQDGDVVQIGFVTLRTSFWPTVRAADTVTAAIELSNQFVASGDPATAIQLLTGLLKVGSGLGLTSREEAEVSCATGELMLKYTIKHKTAIEHLETALSKLLVQGSNVQLRLRVRYLLFRAGVLMNNNSADQFSIDLEKDAKLAGETLPVLAVVLWRLQSTCRKPDATEAIVQKAVETAAVQFEDGLWHAAFLMEQAQFCLRQSLFPAGLRVLDEATSLLALYIFPEEPTFAVVAEHNKTSIALRMLVVRAMLHFGDLNAKEAESCVAELEAVTTLPPLTAPDGDALSMCPLYTSFHSLDELALIRTSLRGVLSLFGGDANGAAAAALSGLALAEQVHRSFSRTTLAVFAESAYLNSALTLAHAQLSLGEPSRAGITLLACSNVLRPLRSAVATAYYLSTLSRYCVLTGAFAVAETAACLASEAAAGIVTLRQSAVVLRVQARLLMGDADGAADLLTSELDRPYTAAIDAARRVLFVWADRVRSAAGNKVFASNNADTVEMLEDLRVRGVAQLVGAGYVALAGLWAEPLSGPFPVAWAFRTDGGQSIVKCSDVATRIAVGEACLEAAPTHAQQLAPVLADIETLKTRLQAQAETLQTSDVHKQILEVVQRLAEQ